MAKIRRIDKDLIVLTLLKLFDHMPKFVTEKEIEEWLRKEASRPRKEKIAEAYKAYEEARKEFQQDDEQSEKIH